jgi:hypothetical protein
MTGCQVTFAMGACSIIIVLSTFDAMSQIQMVVGMVSDLDAISVPDASMAIIFVPGLVFESFVTGEEPIIGGQTVFVQKANVRSKPPF